MNKKLIIILYSLLIASVASPFVQTTTFTSSTVLYICLFISALIAFLLPNRKVHILWILASSIFIMYKYSNPLSLEFRNWIEFFINDISIKMSKFISRELLLIPQEMGLLLTYIIISTSISITAKTKGIWKVYLVCYLFLYMLLSVFLKIQFHESIIVSIGLSLLIGFLENMSNSLSSMNTQKFLILGILMSILICGSNYLETYKSLHLTIIKSTMDLRSYLSSANFYETFNLSQRSSTPSKSGYSTDDSHLGGPLYMDYTEAFSVKETAQTYWRVNSKYMYTGLGWTNGKLINETYGYTLPLQLGKQTLNNQTPINHEILSLHKSIDYIPIPLGYSEYQISSDIDHNLQSNDLLGYFDINGITLSKENNGILVNSNFITSPPVSSKDILNDIVPSLKTEEYINKQITKNISDRVRNLALEITSEGNSMYEKVKLIESYLNSNQQLKYSLSDVPYVPEGADFVEHFLFESQIGYCEHFASTMVVMAQSLGIPARYAKGFSKGTHFNGITSIKNSDAHAWPEIYFEEYGWIAFEPTPSFSIPTSQNNINQEESNQIDNDITIDQQPNEQDNIQINPSSPLEIETIEKQKNHNGTIYWLLGLTIVLVLAVYHIFKTRFKAYFIKYLLNHDKISFEVAFIKIIRLVSISNPKHDSELLIPYVMRLNEEIREHLLPLAIDFEHNKYSKHTNETFNQESKERMLHLLDILAKQ